MNKFAKPKNTFIKPECVSIGELYAFNFNPEAQPKIGKLNSIKDWFDINNNLFCHVLQHSNFKLYVEVSATGRFHFHGYIYIKNICGFYVKDVKELIQSGTSVMKVIEDEKAWEEYVLKQQAFIQPFLESELYGPLIKCKDLIRIYNL